MRPRPPGAPMPRYVILEHDHPHRHWDLMLESSGTLRTWRLAAPPADGAMVDADPLPDHRIAYLDYEGPVSGGRGAVLRRDAGTFEIDRGGESGDSAEGEDGWTIRLTGDRGRWRAQLIQAGTQWLWRFDQERGP